MKKFLSVLHKVENVFACIILVYILIMVLVGVVLRYIFSYSIFGSDEIIGYMVVCLGMLGSAITIRDESNISLDTLISRLSKKAQQILYTFFQIIIAGILAFYIYCSLHMTLGNLDVLAPMSRISMGWPYGFMTASLVLMLLEHLIVFGTKIREKRLYWPQADYKATEG